MRLHVLAFSSPQQIRECQDVQCVRTAIAFVVDYYNETKDELDGRLKHSQRFFAKDGADDGHKKRVEILKGKLDVCLALQSRLRELSFSASEAGRSYVFCGAMSIAMDDDSEDKEEVEEVEEEEEEVDYGALLQELMQSEQAESSTSDLESDTDVHDESPSALAESFVSLLTCSLLGYGVHKRGDIVAVAHEVLAATNSLSPNKWVDEAFIRVKAAFPHVNDEVHEYLFAARNALSQLAPIAAYPESDAHFRSLLGMNPV